MKKILCIGDSITNGARDPQLRGYPMDLASKLRQEDGISVFCMNFGINGETTSQILRRSYQIVASNKDAAALLFLGGTNDSKLAIPVELYKDNVVALLEIAEHFGVPAAIGLVPPVYNDGLPGYAASVANAAIARYNATLVEVTKKNGVPLADFSQYPQSLFCDGVHPNRAGYATMAADWLSLLRGNKAHFPALFVVRPN